jgi:hypothetical protein
MTGPCWGLPPYPEDNEPEDQVIRLRRREAASPDVKITPPARPADQWTATVGGEVISAANHLREVLDDLDEHYRDRP